MKYWIKVTEEFGRGLYAFESFKQGDIITRCELLVLSAVDTIAVNATDLKHYVFRYDDFRDCLVLGDGEIFNHSDTPNVGYRLVEAYGRKVMEFYALKNITVGVQLCTDYNQDVAVNVSNYVAAKSLI